MHIHIPEPEIRLYEDGFDAHDLLNREKDGERLSELVGRIDDPLVIALDGAWGSGKTVFLKCWVGEHLKREGNTDLPVYFDAFRHDYMDDPLISLVGAIGERIEKDESKAAKAWKVVRKNAPSLARIGLAMATYGATEVAGKVGDALINATSKESEKAIDAFWAREQGRRAAMQEFRNALTTLTEPDEQGTPTRKLIIIIDELDRCRPDYALSLLEVIKHFFSVPGVHFVLGVNKAALEDMVRVRYGSGTRAGTYLEKFISLEIRLPDIIISDLGLIPDHMNIPVAQKLFRELAGNMELPAKLTEHVSNYLSFREGREAYNLRFAKSLLRDIALAPAGFEDKYPAFQIVAAGLILLRRLDRQLFLRAQKGTLELNDVDKALAISNVSDLTSSDIKESINWQVHQAWAVFLNPDLLDEAKKRNMNFSGHFRDVSHRRASLRELAHDLDRFHFPEASS